MKAALIDTDTLSLFFRGDSHVTDRFARYPVEHGVATISLITYYEVLSGLRFRDARKQLDAFLGFCRHSEILPLSERSCSISADIYNDLRTRGCLIDDADILIAGVAMAHGLTVATRNRSHFQRIQGLEVDDWSQPTGAAP